MSNMAGQGFGHRHERIVEPSWAKAISNLEQRGYELGKSDANSYRERKHHGLLRYDEVAYEEGFACATRIREARIDWITCVAEFGPNAHETRNSYGVYTRVLQASYKRTMKYYTEPS